MAVSLKLLVITVGVASTMLGSQANAGPATPGLRSADIAQTGQNNVQLTAGKKGTRVRGYTERRGGYSYNQADSINTYGDSRSNYGSASSLRDPSLDKQSVAGPFDHGFFFDSATGARGGDSPYMN
ncbi:MAG: hypothetical protein ABL894_13315 [Hyphomicrobium sp.]